MKAIFQTSQFKKDFKRIKKRGKDLSKLREVVSLIAQSEVLERHRDPTQRGFGAKNRNGISRRDAKAQR
jgi:addiction module RelE/StbE family toxin